MRTKIYFLRGENHFVVYVGKTCGTIEGRLWSHLNEARKGHKCKKCCGIRKMLREGRIPTVTLQTEVEGNGNNAERAYIKWLKSYGIDLWNLTDGGDGQSKGFHHRKDTCIKISRTLSGRPHSEEHNKKVGLANKGKIHTEEQNRVTSESLKGRISPMEGKHHTEKTKQKISEKNKGRVHVLKTCRCASCMSKKGISYRWENK